MSAFPPIGDALASSLIEMLGPDCGSAALVARVALAQPTSVLDPARLEAVPAGALERVLRDFSRRGWLTRTLTGWSIGPAAIPPALPSFLEGAAAMRGTMPDRGRATAVVTLPLAPSAVVHALPATGFSYSGLVSTRQALERIADAAVNNFTVMTPFMNREGLTLVLELFRRTAASHKKLVVRHSGGALSTLRASSQELGDAGVDVFNYTLPAGDGYETFHAKVVLADQDLAYVGSANMTVFARHSMELGVLMDGRAARVIASVVRAVERVAIQVSVGQAVLLRQSS